jgi:allantoin racemase
MHLRVILPIIGDTLIEQIGAEVRAWVSPGTEVDVVSLDRGPASIESEYDEALAGPGILQRVEEASADGVDAIFVSCGADPAIQAAREITDVPVVGGFEPAMLTALTLGERIGILQVLPNVLPMLRGLARRYAMAERLGTIRVIDLPVLGLAHGEDLVDRLVGQAASAVRAGEERLAADGLAVPVVDPTAAAVLWLEAQVRMRLTASRTTYRTPPAKERIA